MTTGRINQVASPEAVAGPRPGRAGRAGGPLVSLGLGPSLGAASLASRPPDAGRRRGGAGASAAARLPPSPSPPRPTPEAFARCRGLASPVFAPNSLPWPPASPRRNRLRTPCDRPVRRPTVRDGLSDRRPPARPANPVRRSR